VAGNFFFLFFFSGWWRFRARGSGAGPGVVEMADGKLFSWAARQGAHTASPDGAGKNWSAPEPTDMKSPDLTGEHSSGCRPQPDCSRI